MKLNIDLPDDWAHAIARYDLIFDRFMKNRQHKEAAAFKQSVMQQMLTALQSPVRKALHEQSAGAVPAGQDATGATDGQVQEEAR